MLYRVGTRVFEFILSILAVTDLNEIVYNHLVFSPASIAALRLVYFSTNCCLTDTTVTFIALATYTSTSKSNSKRAKE